MRLLPLLFLAVGCSDKDASVPGKLDPTGEVLETVNGQPFTQGMVDAVLASMPEENRAQIEQQGKLGDLREGLITQELLYQEAVKRDLTSRPEIQTRLVLAQREVLINSLFEDIAEAAVTDEALAAWYDEHKVQFRKSEARIGQIVVDDEATAKAVMARLEVPGADFSAIAGEVSIDPLAKENGGDTGWVETKALPPELQIFAAQEVGGLAGPRATPNGKWLVLQLLEKRDETVPLEDVKEQIKPSVQSEAVQNYVEELKAARTESASEGASVEVPEAPVAPAAPAAPAGQ